MEKIRDLDLGIGDLFYPDINDLAMELEDLVSDGDHNNYHYTSVMGIFHMQNSDEILLYVYKGRR